MQYPITLLPLAMPGVQQEGQNLPNTVPGIDAGPTGAVEGQTPVNPGAPGGQAQQTTQSPGFFNPIFLMLTLVLVFMVVSTMMSSRREKKRAAEMLSSLKRGDRVLTAGGMLGTIHEVREDSIVLRVDDVSGAKAHFTRGAIQQVIKQSKQDTKADNPAVAEAS